MGLIYKNGISYGGGGSGSGGTSDYTELANKPKINNITLVGEKTTSDLDLVDGSTIYVNDSNKIAIGIISTAQIQNLFN